MATSQLRARDRLMLGTLAAVTVTDAIMLQGADDKLGQTLRAHLKQ